MVHQHRQRLRGVRSRARQGARHCRPGIADPTALLLSAVLMLLHLSEPTAERIENGMRRVLGEDAARGETWGVYPPRRSTWVPSIREL